MPPTRPLLQAVLGAIALWAYLPAASQAPPTPPWPRIVGIEVSGNENTRDKVILREFDLAPGEPADPARISRGRQAVSDLGLFR